MAGYPDGAAARSRFVVDSRPAGVVRPAAGTRVPEGVLIEEEPGSDGSPVVTGTVFLTGAECPWRCVYCDLWRHTTRERTVPGAIPAQVAAAMERLEGVRGLKLYNAGSFFDPGAVPPDDLPAVAALASRFEKVVVECHPALVGEAACRFRDALGGAELEVAMGLETVHPDVLPRLNRRASLASFSRAAAFLARERIGLRAFVLVGPPFLPRGEAVEWAVRSARFAFDQGASLVALIPVRPGNGALDLLAEEGHFAPPSLDMLEAATEGAVRLGAGRAVADLWDLALFSRCPACLPARTARLHALNLSQAVPPPVSCPSCPEGR